MAPSLPASSTSSTASNLFLAATYVLLSAVPFLPLVLGKSLDKPWQTLGIECLAWIAAWAVFKRPAWFHWLLIPAFLALPTELYLITYYGEGISTHHLGIISETSFRETLEFLGKKLWVGVGVMALIVAWWWRTWRIARATRDFDWNDGSRWVALVALSISCAVWAYGEQFGVQSEEVSASESASGSLSESASDSASTSGSASAGNSAGPSVSASPSVSGSAAASGGSRRAESGSGNALALASGSLAADGSASETEEGDEEEEVSTAASASASAPASGLGLPKLTAWAGPAFDLEAFSRSWPFGLAARGVDFWGERKTLNELAQKNAAFKFGARQVGANATPETVVMVIGESSRFDRWSLHGYKRETNPLLNKEDNLISLTDVVTSVSATRLSVPVMLTRKPATQALKAGFSEKSFLTAFKEAGFKTWWLSNQISFGQFDTPVSVFAKEADVIQFMNLGGFTDSSNFDSILLDPLKSALNDPNPKKLIVLHTLGSHWNYSQRHPKEFDKWRPSLFGVPNPAYTDLAIKPQLNNSYDNAILYTDWFLAQVIGTLKRPEQVTSMLYVADHGQTLYDGECKLAFHGHNHQHEFHVPAFVWYSGNYHKAYPEKVTQLKMHWNAKISTENVFHTLLDMADIRYGDERLEWSLASPAFKPHRRYVDSYGWTNYDNATIKGDCREVIDKGTPLKQEK